MRILGDIAIRRATPDDLPVVLDFLTRLAADLNYPPPVPAETERSIRRLLTDPHLRSWFLVAERAGEPLGQVRIQAFQDDLTDREVWYFGRLFVPAAARRLGVATALLASARDEAARTGNVAKLTCNIHTWNTPSLGLHERFPDFVGDGLWYTCPIP